MVAVRFEGNRRFTDEYLKEQIATKEGEIFDPGLLLRDEKALREFFSGVFDIEEIPVEDGVEIVFHVLDRVLVGTVELRGLSRVNKDDVRPLLSTRKGRPLHEHALKSDAEILARLHREKGYHFVEVEAYRSKTATADVEDIIFQVFVGNRVKVVEIVLEGAHSLSRDDLLKVAKNSDRYRKQFLGLARLFNPAWFDRAALEEDRRKMELQYHQEGYLDARIALVGVRFDERRKEATIHYRIDEGARYTLRSVKVEYVDGGLPEAEDREALSPASLEALSSMEIGAPYRVDDVRTTRKDVSERLWGRAYATSQIEERYTADVETRTVDFRFVIRCGPKVREGLFRIYGNRYTRDNVIRRAFRKGATPGDFLDIDELDAGRNRLLGLRFFRFVRFGNGQNWGLAKSPGSPEDEYDVELEIEEDETRNLTFGAGVSTDGGAFATFAVTWRNFDWRKPPEKWWRILDRDAFRGGGQRFTFTASPGTTFSTFTFSFADPAVRDSPWSLSWSAFRRVSLYDDYDQQNDGITIRVGRYLDDDFVWKLDVEWSLQQVILDNPEPDAPVNALDVQGASTLHSLGIFVRRARKKEIDLFLNGHVTTGSLELVGGRSRGMWMSGR
ncbi:MAG: BamA/TamA family outer membrane protein [Planctomycetes bacterium]|nr:BamA/TamA family outer membrane protein [Planctomycetota bacterium]